MATESKTVTVKHDVKQGRNRVHIGSRKAVMRKALAAAGLVTVPDDWEIRWNHPVDGTHTVTLGESYGPRP